MIMEGEFLLYQDNELIKQSIDSRMEIKVYIWRNLNE